jgi:tetratricopeptide (TPR) repeat protein
MSTKFIVTIIIYALLTCLFIYFEIGPLKFLKRIFNPSGDINWTWFGINLIIFAALFLLFVTTISLQLQDNKPADFNNSETIPPLVTTDSLRKEFTGEAEELVNKAESYLKAATHDYEERRFHDAIKNCQKSIDTLPSISAYLNLSAYLTYTSEHKRTEEVFSEGIQLAQKRGDVKAESLFFSNRGSYYSDRGQKDKAALDFTKATELDPNNSAAHFNLAVYYCETNFYENALKELQQFDKLDEGLRDLEGKGTRVYNLRGEIKKGQGLDEEAIIEFNKAIQVNPKFAPAYNNRGISYFNQRHLDLSISDFNKTIELDPTFAGAYSNRGASYAAKGILDKGISDCDTAIKLDPRHSPSYFIRGRIYAQKNLYAKAMLDFNKVIEMNPKDEKAYLYRGRVYELKGNDDEALADFKTAIELNPNYSEAYFHKAKTLTQKKLIDDALLNYDKAIEINPLYSDAFINRGALYISKGILENALADLNKAIAINPKSAEAYNNRGIIYFRQEIFDNAFSDFDKAIELKPDYADTFFNRANTFNRIGQSLKAAEDVKKACSLGVVDACKEYETLKRKTGDSGNG